YGNGFCHSLEKWDERKGRLLVFGNEPGYPGSPGNDIASVNRYKSENQFSVFHFFPSDRIEQENPISAFPQGILAKPRTSECEYHTVKKGMPFHDDAG